jgi:hypothetical protein
MFSHSLTICWRHTGTTKQHSVKFALTAAVKDVVLAEITNRYQLYRTVFDRIFDERKDAIDRHFDIIDRGIAASDKQLILAGLEGLSRIVSSRISKSSQSY